MSTMKRKPETLSRAFFMPALVLAQKCRA